MINDTEAENVKQSVLIIESRHSMMELYKGLLAPYECTIDIACTFDKALNYMRHHEYNLYILNIILNGDSKGVDLIGKGGSKPENIIVLSGELEEMMINELVDLYKIPRSQIMAMPPDNKNFISILDHHLSQVRDKQIEMYYDEKSNKVVAEEIAEMEEKIEDLEDEIEELGDEVVNFKALWYQIKQLTFKQIIIILTCMFVFSGSLATYSTWKGYHEKEQFQISLESYCESRFKNFRKGEDVSSRTYFEEEQVLDDIEYMIRFYPENYIYILVSSTRDKFEPYGYWIASPSYMNEFFKYKGFMEIFIDTWTTKGKKIIPK